MSKQLLRNSKFALLVKYFHGGHLDEGVATLLCQVEEGEVEAAVEEGRALFVVTRHVGVLDLLFRCPRHRLLYGILFLCLCINCEAHWRLTPLLLVAFQKRYRFFIILLRALRISRLRERRTAFLSHGSRNLLRRKQIRLHVLFFQLPELVPASCFTICARQLHDANVEEARIHATFLVAPSKNKRRLHSILEL